MRLQRHSSMRNVLHHIRLAPCKGIVVLIELYQATLSPDHGPLRSLYIYGYCRHEPTCSEYGKEVMLSKGVLRGIPLLCFRLLSCHPWKKPSEKRILSVLSR
ncbi:hypothetical protein COU78_03430 [Candidatus Peregrinibacteria bacterium CG10_big_fil_rev_8_21_14_0_10_49_24]|nr:MAG: hypothetical protein COV83_05250 [Candidatus Peregrinibacteria bacterium CG11_big_fil_rev_8_21_14_0_20_49_14]PIR51172.1 MAG: hypothetical protein COU78_03430 [Candidatus Peregrinibacteria bacterium CG10_big_fil_rev_8_21_14_0_10_49_24]PJA67211.1 MAG: hypothetical protein CO157_05585 [Candidatus Peregrinibacteria bacterium CG_4_9_14_3_um_filter_49_12]